MSFIGWIKLHRSLLEWRWFSDAKMVQFYIYLLCKASHNSYFFKDIELLAGQLPFGYRAASMEIGLSIQEIRTCVKRLVSTQEITHEKHAYGSVITILNWDKYQSSNNEVTINQQLTNNQMALTKNVKNVKNEKNILCREEVEKQPKKHNPDKITQTVEIISFLNEKTNKNFRSNSKAVQKYIHARLNENYTVDDFKKVITTKARQWCGTSMEIYLRPQTLFAPEKFEGYLNENKLASEKSIEEQIIEVVGEIGLGFLNEG